MTYAPLAVAAPFVLLWAVQITLDWRKRRRAFARRHFSNPAK